MQRSLAPERLATLVGHLDVAPAYRALCQALQELIGDGRIPIDTRLPSERAVAGALGVSRNTVTRAYAELASAGFASARQGAGTFAAVPVARRRAHDHTLGASKFADDAIDLTRAAGSATPGTAAAYARALAALPAYLSGDGYLPSGLPALQARIAATYTRRGLATTPGQIVVTAGALSALAIVARTLSRPGDRIVVDTPVYPNAMGALTLGGARLVAAPMGDPLGDAGWDLDGIEATLRETAPRLAYVIADFHNPTGLLMDAAQRARCAAALAAAGTLAVVDETLQATRLSDAPMPAPFATFARDAVTIGSASKLCWGGLRVGWIRAPQPVVARLVAARVQLDLGSSLFDQLVAAELLDDAPMLAARRDQVRRQRDTLAQALRTHLPDWRFRLPDGGLSLWARLPHGSATALAADLERDGVHLAPGPVFGVEGGFDRWLRLPYAKPEAQLLDAVERMTQRWAALPRAGARGRRTASAPPLIA
ncbi:PLP-dependent aminotransferase family protein [Luteimonas sp. S4-F44]|uniref:MocR-like transcription factor YczR n=1 Tax=Luteimonas sp. S4-F44 TaxID=2925842 RepID=UPI001F52E967|nr:PLP-dependent aminotransferase family protein [Luteimonas sp. S4-F44]UNK42420.1 PLP-dependent aminotransferase family protein [Luteimonas sp. S4-F44]